MAPKSQKRVQHAPLLSDVVHDAVNDEHAVHAGVLPHLRLPGLLLPGVLLLRQEQPLRPTRSPRRAEGQDSRVSPPARSSRQLHHQDDRQTQHQGGRAGRVDEGGRGSEGEGGGGGEGGVADRPLQVLQQGGDPPHLSLRAEADEAAEQGELCPLSEETGEAEGADQEGVETVYEVEIAEEEEEKAEEEDQSAAEQSTEEEIRLPQGEGEEVEGGGRLVQEEKEEAEEEDCKEVEVQEAGAKAGAVSKKAKHCNRGEGGKEEGGGGGEGGKLKFEASTIVSGGAFEVIAKKTSEIEAASEIPTAQIKKEKSEITASKKATQSA